MIVPVDCLLRVHGERSLRLTVLTVRNLNLSAGFLLERTQCDVTFLTDEHDIFQLREHATPAGHDTVDSHQAVEVLLAQLSQGKCHREFCNAHMNFVVNVVVLRVVEQGNIESNLVKHLQNLGGFICEEPRKSRLGIRQV